MSTMKKTRDRALEELRKAFRLGKQHREYIMLIAVIALALTLRFVVLPAVMGTDIPVAVVEGRSMFPLLREGDIVFIKRVPPQEIHVGDIIVYEYGGKYIIHRVISVIVRNGNYYYVTKGDNNEGPDPYYPMGVPYDKVKGKVVEISGNTVLKIPYIGYYTLWLNR